MLQHRLLLKVETLADNTVVSNNYCRAVEMGSSILCRCGYDWTGSNTNLTDVLLALGGKVSVGAFRSYAAGGLESSVDILSATSIAQKSIMIIACFVSVWGVGIVFLTLSVPNLRLRRNQKLKKVRALHRNDTGPPASPLTDDTSSTPLPLPPEPDGGATKAPVEALPVEAYLLSSLPVFFAHSSRSVMKRVLIILSTGHKYGRVAQYLFSRENRFDVAFRKQVFFDIVHALTALTMSCFALAILYDLQYPVDDGFCASQTDENSCLRPKTILDPWQSKCRWELTYSDGSVIQETLNGRTLNTIYLDGDAEPVTPCQFKNTNTSLLAFILAFLITSLFSSLLGVLLQNAVRIISSPSLPEQSQQARRGQSSGMLQIVKQEENVLGYLRVLWNRTIFGHQSEEEIAAEEVALRALSKSFAKLRQSVVAGLPEATASSCKVFHRRKSVVADLWRHHPAFLEDDDSMTSLRHVYARAAIASTCGSTPLRASLLLRLMIADCFLTPLTPQTADEATLGHAKRHVLMLCIDRAFPPIHYLPPDHWLRYVVLALLCGSNGAALYFIIAKAAVRGSDWQVSFLRGCLWEWFSEVVITQSFEILVFDLCLCSLIDREIQSFVAYAKKGFEHCLQPNAHLLSMETTSGIRRPLLSRAVAETNSSLIESMVTLEVLERRCLHRQNAPVPVSSPVPSKSQSFVQRVLKRVVVLLSKYSLEVWENVALGVITMFITTMVYVYYSSVYPNLVNLPLLTRDMVLVVLLIAVPLVSWLLYVVYRRYSPSHHVDEQFFVAAHRGDDDSQAASILRDWFSSVSSSPSSLSSPAPSPVPSPAPSLSLSKSVASESLCWSGESSSSIAEPASRPSKSLSYEGISLSIDDQKEDDHVRMDDHHSSMGRPSVSVNATFSGAKHSPTKSWINTVDTMFASSKADDAVIHEASSVQSSASWNWSQSSDSSDISKSSISSYSHHDDDDERHHSSSSSETSDEMDDASLGESELSLLLRSRTTSSSSNVAEIRLDIDPESSASSLLSSSLSEWGSFSAESL